MLAERRHHNEFGARNGEMSGDLLESTCYDEAKPVVGFKQGVLFDASPE